ncbi:sugar transporter ERD6-like 9 isoform X1 [Eutrema salsugineum]|uniref:sugar transporter ERD6-like 9 isoform X1 n=1 Tax=Eutrema salsugineum TaxID=72664 RepID=UPI000CECF1DF|nr:sugar transporter ERD6-like 9 isoform X1 [Eutrema salsugineum]
MEGENITIEKGLLLVKREETSANTTPLLVFTTFIIVAASFTFGVALGYTAGTMSSIMEDLDLSIAQFSVFGSLLTFGGMIGAIFSAKSADAFGRKMTLWLAEVFCISGWLVISLAENIIWLDFGRFFVGIGVGLISYVIPVYIAEITPKNVRGTFTFSNQLLQNCGLATAYYLGNSMSWRTIALIGIIPCMIQFFGLFFIPESPRWLAKEGRDKECEAVLQKLRGKEADVIRESREIMISVDATANISMRSLFKKKYSRQLTIGIGLMLLQQLSGSAGISYYAGSIFELAGFPSRIGMTVLSMVVVPKAILGLILVDRWGRRPLLMASAFGISLSCITLALSFGLKGVPGIVKFTPTMAFIGILTFNMMFAAGLGALPWVIMSEIFPMDMKVVAGSLVTITNWFTGWIVSYCFNFMIIWSQTGTFSIFAMISGLTIVFSWCLVPETRGLTLEEIQLPRANTLS